MTYKNFMKKIFNKNHLNFRYFLSTNSFYDELLAVNIAGQTCLWEVLHHLATQKGLYGQMLDILMRTIHTFSTSNFQPTPCNT